MNIITATYSSPLVFSMFVFHLNFSIFLVLRGHIWVFYPPKWSIIAQINLVVFWGGTVDSKSLIKGAHFNHKKREIATFSWFATKASMSIKCAPQHVGRVGHFIGPGHSRPWTSRHTKVTLLVLLLLHSPLTTPLQNLQGHQLSDQSVFLRNSGLAGSSPGYCIVFFVVV